MTRTSNGGMIARTVTCLPAVIGAWGKPGSGLLLSSSAHFRLDRAAVKRPELSPENLPRAVNMNELGQALTTLGDPPIRSMMVWNCNPAAVCPNSVLVWNGLAREDL